MRATVRPALSAYGIPYQGPANFGGNFLFVETRDMGDEVPELVDSFKNMKTGEFLRVAV